MRSGFIWLVQIFCSFKRLFHPRLWYHDCADACRYTRHVAEGFAIQCILIKVLYIIENYPHLEIYIADVAHAAVSQNIVY